ncbi:MAG: cell envelope biogenesis protein OmpA [Sphingomonas sp. SCN 67-18]|uniref:OmpA family protein n=1 Tax=uncultured Sphingomonas sp. TaxID=158754 RepID=UPI00086C2476|nr:OmpA family protein [Sphingomonas sp. SCN 67-18]ODU20607.1 MAG: cell envelope biogenesis protein OmpA [Sphingomonas sp. SCN 67-18]
MGVPSRRSAIFLISAMLAVSASGAAYAQQPDQADGADPINVYGTPPADLAGLPKGPAIEGIISARNSGKMQVTGADETKTVIVLSEGTEIRGRGGFLGLKRDALSQKSLLNGLPVTVETVQWGDGLIASRIRLRNTDLQTAAMIRNGTAQGFAEQSAATEALRGRVGDIDQYNVKRTTNVYFDTGRWQLSAQAESEICATAREADGTNNALLLVVGYTDSVGDEDYNQVLSEKRAARVVNYLQQHCRWAPYRMLTPTGMAEADPQADNESDEGRAQNRRVSVNILVSKAVDGLQTAQNSPSNW